VPVIVIEEIIRGRLNVIRQAEAGKARISLERAYELFEETLATLGVCKSSHTPHRRNRSATNGVNRASASPHTIYASPPFALPKALN
jgi:hypothetical protein